MQNTVLGSYAKCYGREENEEAIAEIILPHLEESAKSFAPLAAKLIWNRISMVSLFPWETSRKIDETLLSDALKRIRGMIDNQLLLKVK